MSIQPIITFKAGLESLLSYKESVTPPKVTPRPTPGYIYLYPEDDLMHFCWRPRNIPLNEPELELLMLPTDGSFRPHHPTHANSPKDTKKPTNGRIYVLNFSSSSQKHLFWLQSRSQHPNHDPSWFSARDLKLGEIVNNLLQGEEVDVREAIASLPPDNGGDDDETMEDVEGTDHDLDHDRSGSGGAGPDATGGDVREEGEEAREGGADGGRAASMDANAIIQNFIKSMPGNNAGSRVSQQPPDRLFTTLADLLLPASTISFIETASESTIDRLLQYLPPDLTTMAQEADDDTEVSPDHTSIAASEQSLSLSQKREILRKVLRSPQFSQSLSSLTVAIRDGGLPILSESLQIPVRNGGYMRRGGVPLGGGEAVEVFLEGVKQAVQDQDSEQSDRVDTR